MKKCPKCSSFSVKKNGQKRGKQSFKCNSCRYRWENTGNHKKNFARYYHDWLFGRRTLSEISYNLGVSIPKLTKEFDQIDVDEGLQYEFDGNPINLLIDATFFGREYGYLCFHDCRRIIYFKEIKTESVRHLREGLYVLKEAKYVLKSITIDGRRGYYNNIRKIFGNIPIQMCIFHQKAIIRRYITDNPQSDCGQELKELCTRLTEANAHQKFIDDFHKLKEKHSFMLANRNVDGNYRHQSIRSAFRSLDANMMHIFLYTDSKILEIPPTINHLEGLFSHLKERINIHRGLRLERKKKAIKFLLRNLGRKSRK